MAALMNVVPRSIPINAMHASAFPPHNSTPSAAVSNFLQQVLEVAGKWHGRTVDGFSAVLHQVQQQTVGGRVFIQVLKHRERADDELTGTELVGTHQHPGSVTTWRGVSGREGGGINLRRRGLVLVNVM